ncbi:hypothetical protein FRC10_002315, partial [Ceratobasidium sp. 414]
PGEVDPDHPRGASPVQPCFSVLASQRSAITHTSLSISTHKMDKLGDHLKRQFQRLSRSTTPEPSPNPAGCPEPPISIAPSIMPTSAGSSSDSVVGPPRYDASLRRSPYQGPDWDQH